MQSPDLNQNYFELFGLPVAYEVDRSALRSQQRRLQASFHPDRYVNADDRERRLSVEVASWIKQAYETLQDPVKRARYLLVVNGVDVADESATTADTAFLMEQMALREEIDACADATDGLQRSERVAERLRQRASELALQFVTHYDAGDFAQATEVTHKMQFIQRIQQQLDELQFELEGR